MKRIPATFAREKRPSKAERSHAGGLSPDEIDERVIAQADDDGAWQPTVHVARKAASIGLSASLMQRASFLARLHRERNLQTWVERVVRERVELEEHALTQARRELATKNGG